MRVLWFSPFHESMHGVRWGVRGLAAALSARGHTTAVVTRRPKHLGRGLHATHEDPGGLRVWRVTLRPFPPRGPWRRAGLRALRTFAELVRVVAAERPDVVHAHGLRTGDLSGSFALQVLALRRLGRCPLVVHFHRTPLAPVAGDPAPVDRHAVGAATLVLACSGNVLAYLRAAFPEAAARTELFPEGCDPEEFPSPGEPEGDYLLAAGRFVPEKGFDVLIEAFRAVAREYPELRLVLAGNGPERERLAARAAAAGLAGRISFPGALPRSELLVLYRRAVALCCPSREDFMPLVVLEAMAAGRAVVATSVGAVPGLVVPGETGLLAPPGDPPALAAALRQCLDDPGGRRAMGVRAREAVAARYSWGALAERLVGLYGRAGITR